MNRVVNFLQKYFAVISVLIGISILLSVTFSSYIVTSNNHKAAEMYIGELKYSIEIDGSSNNTLTVPTGETIIDVKVNNLNPVDTYYKLLYLKNTNITVKYYESTKDTKDVVTTYNKPCGSITSSNSNTIKLLITNSSTSSQNIAFTMKGGYITNTLEDIVVPSTYSEITTIETPSSNTYFCKTNDTLKQGLKYVNGQYTYAYKQEGKSSSNSSLAWSNITNNGWGVQLTNKTSTDAVTSRPCTYINNKPMISMPYMFYESQAVSIDLSNFNTTNVTNMRWMLSYTKAKALDLSSFDTSNVIDMDGMFAVADATSLDLSNFDTSNVVNMSGIFVEAKATTIDVSNFNTNKVTDMSYMFASSEVLELDLSSFDTSNVTNIDNMFSKCKVAILDLSSFDTSKVTSMYETFTGSNELNTIYVSTKFVVSNVNYYKNMFKDCINLVGGAGTTYNSSYVDKTYAHIDGGTSNPGYFTNIADKPSNPNSFATDSWETIIANVKSGNINRYKVGDTKAVNLGSTYGIHTLRIANMTTPSSCNTSGFSKSACGFVIEFADIILTRVMNDTQTSAGGWPATSMRTFINNEIYNSLPSILQNGIINTTVVSGYESGASSNYISTDKLYLLAPSEIWSDWSTISGVYDTAKNKSRQLDYYNSLNVTTTNYSGAMKKKEKIGKRWCLRTAYSIFTGMFYHVGEEGSNSGGYANTAYGVSPAFRIG